MIACTLLRFVSKGWILLDSKAASILPSLSKPLSIITVRQLLTHTSGLPDFWNDGPDRNLAEWAAELKMKRPDVTLRPLSALWCWFALSVLGHLVRLNRFMFE